MQLRQADSSFSADQTISYDANGEEQLLIIVKQTWSIDPTKLSLSEDQRACVKAPQFLGDPTSSSLKFETDYFPPKLGTDLLLTGTLVLPRPCRETDFQFQVGAYAKRLRITGERRWLKTLVSYRASAALPFEHMPLYYERAFGGIDHIHSKPDQPAFFRENPVGCGFVIADSRAEIENTLLPNLEDPTHRLSYPGALVPVACLGPLASMWQQRAQFSGTYDAHWADTRSPLLPSDFDTRFYVTAPPGMNASPHLKGDEPFAFGTPDFVTQARLPGVTPRISVRFGFQSERPMATLETLQVDLDCQELVLTWKALVSLHKRLNAWAGTEVDMGGRL